MSFTTSIAGNCPPSQFVYTTTTVSVDNISAENVSITNASISVLTTDIFLPVNINTSVISTNDLTVTNLATIGQIHTSYIHVSNVSLDGTIGGHTANLITLNADHAVVDALYLNEQSAVLTDKSLIKRDANQVMFIGKNSSTDVTGADFLFRTGTETGAVKLTIPRSSDVVEMIALDVGTTIQATTGIFSAINTSDLNVADTTTLSELEVLTEASIRNLNVIGPNGLTATKGTITNLSSTKATLTNASITNLSISGDFNASGTSRFYNLTAEYFQSYITGVFQDMDAVTGNITTFESNNISNNILIKTNNLSAVNTSISNNLQVGSNILCDSMNVTNILTASTLSAATVNAGILLNASTMNALLVNTSNLSAINASVDNNLNVRFGVTCGSVNASTTITAPKLNGTNISSTNISAANITASSVISAPTLTATTTFSAPGGSIDNFTTKDIVINDLVTAGSSEFQRGNDKLFIYGDSTSSADITIEPSISRVTMTNISATKITGEISQMLNAGTGIALSTNTNGITTISNTGGSVTDPLNLSTLNASTINVSTLNADEIEGFTKSTEYAFQATSSQNSNQSVTAGTVLNFNLVQYETPAPVYVSGFVSEGYDTALKQYLIPVSGYYQFGFKAFIQSNSDDTFRLAMYVGTPGVGDALIGRGGSKAGMSEDFTLINYFDKGQWVYIKGYSGTENVYMGDANDPRSWFWGHKLTPANNQIVSTTNLSIQNLSVADEMTATTIKATNISATTMTFDTASGDKSITTIGEIDAVKFNASVVHISNDLTLDPGGSMRVQAVVPGNDLLIYSNPGNFFIGNFGTNTLNIGSGSLTNDISISPSGVITVDNLTSTNAITAPSATITNISSTDLTIASSLTGAGNINITGDIQTTGIINGATLTGNIGGNLSAGTGIVLSTVAGVTNISNLSPYQLPVSRVFAARTTGLQQPNPSGNDYYTNHDQIDQASSHVNYVAVPISNGGVNTGAIIQTAGTYKITFTQQVYNNSYTNRVSWWSRATKNNTPTGAQTFVYTRSDQSQYAQYGSNSVTWIETCAVNDYLQVWTTVAKNSPAYNNNWSGLRGGIGSMIVIELLT